MGKVVQVKVKVNTLKKGSEAINCSSDFRIIFEESIIPKNEFNKLYDRLKKSEREAK